MNEMTEDVLTFSKNSALLELGPQESGVQIILGKESSSIGDNRLWLHGSYQIDSSQAKQLNRQPLHQALVITWVSDGVNDTKNLVGDVILFSDDEQMRNNLHIGYFNYDLTDWLNMYERRKYFITVSLGYFISNTLEVEVNPVPYSE